MMISNTLAISISALSPTQGTLGAAFAAVGIAVTQSMAGSGLIDTSLPVPSAPKVSASKSAAAPKAASAPKSKIAFVRGE
jgi:hypothetical protein